MKNIKPISFIAVLIVAVLAGLKTMTRRVIHIPKWALGGYENFEIDESGELVTVCADTGCMAKVPTRFHKGDVLWVKETYQLLPSGFDEIPPVYHYIYKATDELSLECTRWRSSRFMPRRAARLWLRVTDVRCERVREITEDDAQREGVSREAWMDPINGFRYAFEKLWDSINAKRGYGWTVNPWVEVVTFERCEKPEDV